MANSAFSIPSGQFSVQNNTSGPVSCQNAYLYTNNGASADITYNLPSGSIGKQVRFYANSDSYKMIIDPGASVAIQVGSWITGANENVETILNNGSLIELTYAKTNVWEATITVGSFLVKNTSSGDRSWTNFTFVPQTTTSGPVTVAPFRAYDNRGASSTTSITYNLPSSATQHDRVRFACLAEVADSGSNGNAIVIESNNASNNIRVGSNACANNGSCECNTIGNSLELEFIGTTWVAREVIGSWLLD